MHEDWLGLAVADPSGRPYGRLDELFVGRSSGAPEFGIVTVGEGEAGDDRVAIPLLGAQKHNDVLVLPLDPERVIAAPRVQGDVEEIPADAGRMILRHFGMEAEETAEMRAVQGDPVAVPPEEMPEAGVPAAPAPAVAEEEAADVVVSEEQLAVETRSVPTERVRVRKAVVTEDVTVTVTLRREELVIDREPIAPGSDVAPDEGAMTGEGALEFVLHAEEPVVTKRIVPVERVRLHRNTLTEEHRVTDTVRKEQVAVDEEPITREEPTR